MLATVGPLGRLVEPWGDVKPEEASSAFSEQMQGQLDAGAHGVIIETFGVIEEIVIAVRAAREAGAPNIVCTMSFEGGGRTFMGVTPTQAIDTLREAGADVVGANCGGGPAEILAAVQEMHEVAPAEPLVAQPNAGKPRLVSSETAFGVTPEVMSFYVPAFLEAGVRLLGACCGSTPAHLRAMASAVAQQTTEASR